jgi:type I restriction enzyme M protein
LAPNGFAGFVLANGALSNVNRSEEVAIRKALVEAGVIDCIVSLPSKLFANTQIAVSLWFIARDRSGNDKYRSRASETLFIDGRKLGHLISKKQRELSDQDIEKVVATYHNFRDKAPKSLYVDIDGFCKVASKEEIEQQAYVLTPGRFVGTPEVEANELSPEERLNFLQNSLLEEIAKSSKLEQQLREVLSKLSVDE